MANNQTKNEFITTITTKLYNLKDILNIFYLWDISNWKINEKLIVVTSKIKKY